MREQHVQRRRHPAEEPGPGIGHHAGAQPVERPGHRRTFRPGPGGEPRRHGHRWHRPEEDLVEALDHEPDAHARRLLRWGQPAGDQHEGCRHQRARQQRQRYGARRQPAARHRLRQRRADDQQAGEALEGGEAPGGPGASSPMLRRSPQRQRQAGQERDPHRQDDQRADQRRRERTHRTQIAPDLVEHRGGNHVLTHHRAPDRRSAAPAGRASRGSIAASPRRRRCRGARRSPRS